MSDNVADVLLLGSSGVGKTLLLKRMTKKCPVKREEGWPVPTIPTTGAELATIKPNRKKVVVRELGGCMGPVWPRYYQDCRLIWYMIDLSNWEQVASAAVGLWRLLAAPETRDASVLVLLNKCDVKSAMTYAEFDNTMRMDDLVATSPQAIETLPISAVEGWGVDGIHAWLRARGKL
eukprot:Opistho-2@70591